MKRDYLRTFLVFLFFSTGFILLYFSLNLFFAHDDSFFHIRFTELLRERGVSIFYNFPWIYFSKMAQGNHYFAYYNFLYYLILLPFTYITPLFLGLKLYATLSAAFGLTLFYYLLRKLKVMWPLAWTLLWPVTVSFGLMARLLMARPFVLAPVLLLALIISLHYKKYWLVALLTIVYFYWHTATFFFPLGITAVYLLFQQMHLKRFDKRLLASVVISTLVGVAATILISSGFLNFMKEIIFHSLWDMFTLGNKVAIAEGGELYPADFFDFLRGNILLLILFTFASVNELYLYVQNKRTPTTLSEGELRQTTLRFTMFFLSLGLLWATFLSFRNADFFAWFGLLFSCLGIENLIQRSKLDFHVEQILKIAGVIIILYLVSSQALTLYKQLSNNKPFYAIEEAANWLQKNTRPGEVVFISNWSYFTRLFYYNPSNFYTMGIEPRFLYDFDHELYWLSIHIANDGYACSDENCPDVVALRQAATIDKNLRPAWYLSMGNDVAKVIKTQFQSHYVLVNKDQVKFSDLLANNNNFERVYSSGSGDFMVYRIK